MLSKNPVKCYDRGIVELAFNWLVSGASGAVGTLTGNGVAVALTATAGLYTVTFSDYYQGFVSGSVDVQYATATSTNFDIVPQFGAYDASAKTLAVRLWDYSGAALADLADGDSVHVTVKMKWTSV